MVSKIRGLIRDWKDWGVFFCIRDERREMYLSCEYSHCELGFLFRRKAEYWAWQSFVVYLSGNLKYLHFSHKSFFEARLFPKGLNILLTSVGLSMGYPWLIHRISMG